MKAIDQSQLIEKFISFIKIDRERSDRSEPLSFEEIKKYRSALCFGFSVVHSYMASVDKLEWWKSALEKMAAWDPKDTQSLEEKTLLPQANNPNETLNDLFQRAVSYVLFNFSDERISGIENQHQFSFLKAGSLFDSENGKIVHYSHITGHFSRDDLKEMLRENLFSGDGIFLTTTQHACAIRHSKNKWYFYDPNNQNGEIECANTEELISAIYGTQGNLLTFSIASWNVNMKEEIDAFSRTAFIAQTNALKNDSLIDGKDIAEMIDSGNSLASEEKINLFCSLSQKIDALKPERADLMLVKLDIIIRIENYLHLKTQTSDANALNTHIRNACKLKKEILHSTDDHSLCACIENSLETIKPKFSPIFWKKKSDDNYTQCLNDCLAMANRLGAYSTPNSKGR